MKIKISRNDFSEIHELPLHRGISLIFTISACEVTYCKRRYVLLTAPHLNLSQCIPALRSVFRKKGPSLPRCFSVWMHKKEAERGLHLPLKRHGLFVLIHLKEEGLENITKTQEALRPQVKSTSYRLEHFIASARVPLYKRVEQSLHRELLQPQMLCTSVTCPTFCLFYLTIPFLLFCFKKDCKGKM